MCDQSKYSQYHGTVQWTAAAAAAAAAAATTTSTSIAIRLDQINLDRLDWLDCVNDLSVINNQQQQQQQMASPLNCLNWCNNSDNKLKKLHWIGQQINWMDWIGSDRKHHRFVGLKNIICLTVVHAGSAGVATTTGTEATMTSIIEAIIISIHHLYILLLIRFLFYCTL